MLSLLLILQMFSRPTRIRLTSGTCVSKLCYLRILKRTETTVISELFSAIHILRFSLFFDAVWLWECLTGVLQKCVRPVCRVVFKST